MFDEQPDGDPHGECAAEIQRLEGVIRRAANIMRGGEGVEDQGEAWDRVQRLLDETVADMTPNELGHRPETAGGRHGSGGPTGSAPCGPERNSNMDEILKLREELERERMRLAACGVVALANTPDSAEKARTMHDDYRSASCDDVARAVDRQMALHNALTAVMSYPGVRDYLGRQVSEIADSALMGPNVK